MSPRVFGVRERRDQPVGHPPRPTREQLEDLTMRAGLAFMLAKKPPEPPAMYMRVARWLARLLRRERLPMLPRATALIDKLGNRR